MEDFDIKPMTVACMEAVVQFGTKDRPITCHVMGEVTGLTRLECSGAMSRNMRREPHLFRRPVRQAKGLEYGYWIDMKKLNPNYGLSSITLTRQSLEVRRTRASQRRSTSETRAQALNPKGIDMKERAVLSNAESFKLYGLIQTEYTEKRLDDTEFAAYAAEKLGIPKITNRHVGTARRDLDIKSTRDIERDASKLTIAGRLASLEEQVRDLTEKLRPLLT